MKGRMYSVMLTTAWIAVAGSQATAQSSDVTFQVPVNVTRLSSDIGKLAVYCEITSAALPKLAGQTVGRAQKQVELTPAAGQIVQTVAVVVPISSLDTSASTSANYRCTLSGFSQSLQRWSPFSDTNTVTAFRLSPTPMDLVGMFTW